MLLFFAYSLLFLLTINVNLKSKTSNVKWDDKYKDLGYYGIDIKTYCASRPCVVKCCGRSEMIYNGACEYAFVDEENEITNAIFSVYNRLENGNLNVTSKTLHDMVFVQNQKFWNETTEDYSVSDMDVFFFEDGSVSLIHQLASHPWIDVPPLEYCVDYNVDVTMSRRDKHVVFKVTEQAGRNTSIVNLIIIGTLVSVFFTLLIVYIIIRRYFFIALRRQRIRNFIIRAYTFSLVIAYLLKVAQLLSLAVGAHYTHVCKTTSPALYFFILSTFFWSSIAPFNLAQSWRQYRREGKFTVKEYKQADDYYKFVQYSLFGWGVPFILTVALLSLNEWNSDERLHIERPPFDSCFSNEHQTLLYVYVPATIIGIVNCATVMYLCYNFNKMKHMIPATVDVTQFISTSSRRIIYFKCFALMVMNVTIQLVPVPTILYYGIMINSFVACVFLSMLFLFDSSVFSKMAERVQESRVAKQATEIAKKIWSPGKSENQDKVVLISTISDKLPPCTKTEEIENKGRY